MGTALACVGVALALGGCGVVREVPRPPGPAVTDFVPSQAPSSTPAGTGNLSPDGFQQAQRMAVRVRNIGCDSLSTGSGFAIDATTLITNRHVVADSAELQVSTYDGRDIAVTASSTAALADLAVVRTAQELPSYPELAGQDPVIGDAVTVVGYPQGGVLTLTTGRVIGTTTDPLNENLGEVLVADAPVEPGSSGSAVLDVDGRVVGVVYAKNAADQSYIVPVSTLRTLLADEGAFSPTASCTP
ncbi:MAG TPA: serine protease [Actinotalea sp.]|nr:serine protease [Actinotalea sp.]